MTVGFDDLAQLRAAMIAAAPALAEGFTRSFCTDMSGPAGDADALGDAPFASAIVGAYEEAWDRLRAEHRDAMTGGFMPRSLI